MEINGLCIGVVASHLPNGTAKAMYGKRHRIRGRQVIVVYPVRYLSSCTRYMPSFKAGWNQRVA